MAFMSRSYWDARYSQDPQPFDWYQRYSACESLRTIAAERLNKEGRTLIVGCGSSRLAEELLADGYKALCNADWCPTVITQLEERFRRLGVKGVDNKLIDVRAMGAFADGSYDAVFDKATLDTILSSENGAESVERMLSEISRVLKSGGTYLLLSNAPPAERLMLLDKPAFGWVCTSQSTIAKPVTALASKASGHSNHFVYVMSRRTEKEAKEVAKEEAKE